MPIRRQAITWTNVALVYWKKMHESPGLNVQGSAISLHPSCTITKFSTKMCYHDMKNYVARIEYVAKHCFHPIWIASGNNIGEMSPLSGRSHECALFKKNTSTMSLGTIARKLNYPEALCMYRLRHIMGKEAPYTIQTLQGTVRRKLANTRQLFAEIIRHKKSGLLPFQGSHITCHQQLQDQGLVLLLLTLNMLDCFKDYKRYLILNDILTQADDINSRTTIQVVCPTQPIPCLLMLWRL